MAFVLARAFFLALRALTLLRDFTAAAAHLPLAETSSALSPQLLRTARSSHVELTARGVLKADEVWAASDASLLQLDPATAEAKAPGPPSIGGPSAIGDLEYSFLTGWDFHQHKVVQKDCGSALSGVSNKDVLSALAHNASLVKPISTRGELAALQGRRYFIAAHLHQSADVLPRWTMEVVRLLMTLRSADSTGNVDNVFVSIVESQTTIKSRKYIKALETHLHFLGVPFIVVRGKQFQTNTKAKDFYAKARNKVLEPLRDTSRIYDKVIMLEAKYFCADATIGALFSSLPVSVGGLGADAVCGMDYGLVHDYWGSHCLYHSVRETRDMTGQPFQASKPVAGLNEEDYEYNLPFQVFSCWAGVVVFSADIIQEQHLLFRTNRLRLSECSTSETELFFRDMWKVGKGKTIVMPALATGLASPAFQKCALRRQPHVFNHTKAIQFGVAPDTVSCCPMSDQDVQDVDFSKCVPESWDRFGSKVPRYRTSPLSPTLLLDGDVTFLLSRGQMSSASDMAADTLNERLALIFTVMFVLGVMTERFRGLRGEHTLTVVLLLCGVSSLAMHIMNKIAVSVLPLPFTLVAVQMLITDVLMLALFDGKSLVTELWRNFGDAKRWSYLSILHISVLLTMMRALEEGTAMTCLVIRNALPLISTCLEWLFCAGGRGAVSVQSCLALYCLALGTLICTIYDLKFFGSWTDACWIFVNMVLTLAYRLCTRHLLSDPCMALSFPAMLLVSNVAGLFLVMPLSVVYGEHHLWLSPRVWSTLLEDPSAAGCILLSGCIAASLGYYTVVAQKQVTATCMLVVQSASKMVAVTGSILMFSLSWYWSAVLGCVVSLAGCAWYFGSALRPEAGEVETAAVASQSEKEKGVTSR